MLIAPRRPAPGEKSWYQRPVPPLHDDALKDSIVLLLWEGPAKTRMQKSASDVLALLPSMHPKQPADHWKVRQAFIERTVAELKEMYAYDTSRGLASRLQIMYTNLRPRSVTIYSPKVTHKTPYGAGIDLLKKILPGPVQAVAVPDLESVDHSKFGEFTACFDEGWVVELGGEWLRTPPAGQRRLEVIVRGLIGDELPWQDPDYLRALDVWEIVPSARVQLARKKSRGKASGIEEYRQARMDFDAHYIVKLPFESLWEKKPEGGSSSSSDEDESRLPPRKRKRGQPTSAAAPQ